MTIEKFRQITNNLPAETIILLDGVGDDLEDAKTISINYHTDGRTHLVLSNKE